MDFPLQGESPQIVALSPANILWIFPCKFDSTLLRVIVQSIREVALTGVGVATNGTGFRMGSGCSAGSGTSLNSDDSASDS